MTTALPEIVLAIPAGAIIDSASVTITAEAPGAATIGDVAQVRASGDGSSVVMDFQGLRTIAGLDLSNVNPSTLVKALRPWVGTQFGPSLGPPSAAQVVTVETYAERLLLDLVIAPRPVGVPPPPPRTGGPPPRVVAPGGGGAGVATAVAPAFSTPPVLPSAGAIAAGGVVQLPTPPTDLEVTVNGTRAWFQSGPAHPNVGTTFTTDVNITAAAQAVARAGGLSVRVGVRCSAPGRLKAEPKMEVLNTTDIVFTEGPTRVVALASEGDAVVELPFPLAGAPPLTVAYVELTITGEPGPSRVVPQVGPSLSADSMIALDPDHGVVVELPDAAIRQLATLTGIRLPLSAPNGGGEMAGVLRTGRPNGRGPGDVIPQVHLGPTTVEAGADPSAGWTTVALAKPYPLQPGQQLWVGLQMTRGELFWPLALPGGLEAGLRRQAPGGQFVRFSAVAGLATETETALGAVRVVGESRRNQPLPALEISLVGSQSPAVFVIPNSDGVKVTLGLPSPALSAAGSDPVRIHLRAWTPGSYTLGPVRVVYRKD